MTISVKPFRYVMQIALCVTLLLGITSSLSAQEHQNELPQVIIETSEGVIEVTLRPDIAPETVDNFLAYVSNGFYEGTIFHRVIPGFMIQGGGFDKNLNRKQTRDPVRNEAKPTAKNLRGTIAMARTSSPDSATSQFFINLADNDFLNAGVRGPGYTVFGKVSGGMGVVDAIAGKATGRSGGMGDVPKEPVIIHSVSRKKADSATE
ncbi:peptidylprolyl isomerase [Marinobacter orientalis]|uniref:Peptidyl-prolyl cis-trans isomerase n=1 Tax=Marinobacter orientalis TaxID=1928859 RepID=A0A7Y0REL1_9GAMM|nr:peptidylprolyl isomerase [Marinobacter orientalis]NMT64829.1 peptidyl-prolyl cis-trans isomerase [Marinobacter orientalis]TGX49027.1 peptidyl-prolyl cis-trans isomerase [Marinobacter orientalis]